MTIRVVRSFSEIKPAEWDLLSGASRSGPGYNPFISHAFLSALEDSGSATAETGWMERVRDAHLYRYHFDGATFAPWDEADGQYVAHDVVYPERVERIDDLLALHAAAEVELRFTPRLGTLMDRILQSGLPFSFVRIRDAKR